MSVLILQIYPASALCQHEMSHVNFCKCQFRGPLNMANYWSIVYKTFFSQLNNSKKFKEIKFSIVQNSSQQSHMLHNTPM